MSVPTVFFLEQPGATRFRYECEALSLIPGETSRMDRKNFPSIKIDGFQGRAYAVVSCVTADEPYRQHPYMIVGRKECEQGVCKLKVPTDTMILELSNIGIRCVKKCDFNKSLKDRKTLKVDPFKAGFESSTNIDLKMLRLCIQTFIEDNQKWIELPPLVSIPIVNKRSLVDLSIVQLSYCVCPADGGDRELMLFCEKVFKGDVEVRFFEISANGDIIWDTAVTPSLIHKQYGVTVSPPPYKDLTISNPVNVFIQLRKPTDGQVGETRDFQYIPVKTDIFGHYHKKPKVKHNLPMDEDMKQVFTNLEEQGRNHLTQMQNFIPIFPELSSAHTLLYTNPISITVEAPTTDFVFSSITNEQVQMSNIMDTNLASNFGIFENPTENMETSKSYKATNQLIPLGLDDINLILETSDVSSANLSSSDLTVNCVL